MIMSYKVKEISKIAGVSVRTLHHYDDIGLLSPAFVTSAGYRYYSDEDLERLQQILYFKELDFSLQAIKNILDTPGFDKKKALYTHKELLIEKMQRVKKLIASVEKTIGVLENGLEISKKEMFDGFDMKAIEKHKKKYSELTKERYGSTESYKESVKKTSKYSKENWASIHAESEAINYKILENMHKGPKDPLVQALIAKLRQHITDNYYNCTLEIFRDLGDLYVEDEHFRKNIDKAQTGYSEFLREAMHYYCDITK